MFDVNNNKKLRITLRLVEKLFLSFGCFKIYLLKLSSIYLVFHKQRILHCELDNGESQIYLPIGLRSFVFYLTHALLKASLSGYT